jgi:hypothetical protein
MSSGSQQVAAATDSEVEAIARQSQIGVQPQSFFGAEPPDSQRSDVAAANTRPSQSRFEQTMSRPHAFSGESSFLGQRREYTRQRFYRKDDSDMQARYHDEDLDSVRRGYAVPLKDLDEDPYAEGGHMGVFEKDTAIEQFRSDVRSSAFRQVIDHSRNPTEDTEFAAADNTANASRSALRSMRQIAEARKNQRRTREEIIRVMERQEQQRTMFTINYAGCIPTEYLDEFLSGTEAKTVCDVLMPMLLTTSDDRFVYHIEEGQVVRALYNVGVNLERSDTFDVQGHLRQHVASFEDEIDRQWYTDDMLQSVHMHYNSGAETTRIRQLTFQIPTAAAGGERAQLQDASDAQGYRVKVVCHLVKESSVKNVEARNVLCFRAFHFTRYY